MTSKIHFRVQANRIAYRSRVPGLSVRAADWIGLVAVPQRKQIKAQRVFLRRNSERVLFRVKAIRRFGKFPSILHVPDVVKGLFSRERRIFAGRGA